MQITQDGFIFDRVNDKINQLEDSFMSIYGSDIDLSPDSPDGQIIGLLAQLRIDVAEIASMAISAIDPDTASGHWQEINAAYAGIKRKSASYSYLREVILTGEAGAFIPNGSSVLDSNKNRWILVGNITLNEQGSAQADFRSEKLGKYYVPANTELKIETIVLGWLKAVSQNTADLGEDEETDPQLRARAYRSRSKPAQNSVEAVEANVRDVVDVSNCLVLENVTNTVDKNDVPPHSINVIVEGGKDEVIAKAIYDHKSAGCGMMGSVSIAYQPETGLAVPILFDRPKMIDCAAYIEIERLEAFSEVDIEQIKRNIAHSIFQIGQDVHLTRLFTPINRVEGFVVTQLKIGLKGQTLEAKDIAIGVRDKAQFAIRDIDVVIV